MNSWDVSGVSRLFTYLHIIFTRRTFTLVSGWRHYLADFTLDLLGYWKGHCSISLSPLAYDLVNPEMLPGEGEGEGFHPTSTPEGGRAAA